MWLKLIQSPLLLGLLLMLTLAVIIDLVTYKIPNMIILFGLVFSLIGQTLLQQGAGGFNWLAGVAVAFTGFMPLYLARGMAAGDVKLMMAVGGFLGYPLIITALASTYIVGGMIAIIMVVFKGKLSPLIQNLHTMLLSVVIKATSGVSVEHNVLQNSVGRMPYALAIAIGTIVALVIKPANIN